MSKEQREAEELLYKNGAFSQLKTEVLGALARRKLEQAQRDYASTMAVLLKVSLRNRMESLGPIHDPQGKHPNAKKCWFDNLN